MNFKVIAQVTEVTEDINLRQAVLVWLIASFGAALSGPFGTYVALDFPSRAVFWATMIGVTFALAGSVRLIVFRVFSGWQFWLRESCACALMAPVLTLAIWMLAPLLLGAGDEPEIQPLWLLVYVFGIAVIVALLRVVFSGGAQVTQVTPFASAGQALPRLMDRVPDELRGDILRLTGQDHLVEVVTVHGNAKVRMRFSDAIAEMEPIEGYCAHRSHWVTRSAIEQVEKDAGKLFLKLSNGDRVPVSRKYRPGLERAGIV